MAAQASGGLGSAAGFAVLAKTAVTCTDGNITGLVGVASSSTAITKTRCHMQTQVAPGAYADFRALYTGIAGSLTPCTVLTGTLAGQSLGAGTYCFPAAAALTGTLTLMGTGPWLFEIGTTGGALSATNFTVVGSNPCNAMWWVQADVTTTDSMFQGTILGGGDITLTRTSLDGRAFATGAVSMTGGSVFGCAAGTGHDKDKDKDKDKQHCNQGVGNGPEGCDPGNSNHRHTSNDELGGTPGDPGRQGGRHGEQD